jgi:hypothetical protein
MPLFGSSYREGCSCTDRSAYWIERYSKLELEYEKLEKLVDTLLEAGNIDHPVERDEQHYKAIARLQAWKMRGSSQPSIKKSR